MFRRPWFAYFFTLTVCGAPLHGATVLLDNFNRTGSLSDSVPTTNTGQTWTATGAYMTDGSKLVADPAFLQAAYLPLPVPITSGNVYTVSATTAYNVASSDDLAYMMFGFFDSTPSYDGSTVFDGGNTIAIGPRNRRDSVANILDGHSHPSDITSPDGTNGVTFGVRLYESTPNAWVADLVELAPHTQVLSLSPTPVSIGPISTIGMVSASTHPPFIDNFTFDVSAALPDYNRNNSVDAADYVVWRNGLGTTYTQNDYTVWRANFDRTAGGGAGANASTAVPEPVTLVMLVVAVAAVSTRRRLYAQSVKNLSTSDTRHQTTISGTGRQYQELIPFRAQFWRARNSSPARLTLDSPPHGRNAPLNQRYIDSVLRPESAQIGSSTSLRDCLLG